jgi:hypothetical protein
MSYAVMQTGLEPPSAEQLKQAFLQVPGLAAMDVITLGKDAFGVLVKGFELERATAMQSALAAQGVETEVVDDAVLTELPPPRQLNKAAFTPEALLIDDWSGQGFPLEWNDLGLIAAGRTRLAEFTRDLVTRQVVKFRRRGIQLKTVTEAVTKEAQKDHWLLEILTRGAALRYHAVVDHPEALLLFQCLGDRRVKDPAANLVLLVQELAKYAPAAVLNHGAFFMRETGDPSFYYPSKTAFYREITWLLWMESSGRIKA